MTDWLEQYSTALDLRDAREHAHKPYIDAFTRLADRTAAASLTSRQTPPLPTEHLSTSAPPSRSSHPKSKAPDTYDPTPTDLLTSLRADLAATQRARSALQSTITDLTLQITHLTTTNRLSTSQITTLTKQKAEIERRLKDREEEMRGKAGLVEQAQDEMVALGLQLNISEEKSGRLEKENKELVERWMKRMGEEVERVNRDSRWE